MTDHQLLSRELLHIQRQICRERSLYWDLQRELQRLSASIDSYEARFTRLVDRLGEAISAARELETPPWE